MTDNSTSGGTKAGARSLREEGLTGRHERVNREASQVSGPEVAQVIDHRIGERSLLVREYVPLLGASSDLAGVVYLLVHGGGGVFGSVKSYEAMSRELCATTMARVFAVDYRLAPETPLPGAVEDVETASDWLNETLGIASERILLVGDSMGGLIAANAVVGLLGKRKEEQQPRALCLLYPNADLTLRYVRQEQDVPALPYHKQDLEEIVELLGITPDVTRLSPLDSCVNAAMPPTFVVTAQYDVLKPEAVEFVARLAGVGVRTAHVSVPGMAHGFFSSSDRSPLVVSDPRSAFP